MIVNVISLVPAWKRMYPKIKLIRSDKDVTMNSLLLEHRKAAKAKLKFKREASSRENVSKESNNYVESSADLVHTMMDVMNALQIMNQKNLNGAEINSSEWQDFGTIVAKLNDLVQAKNLSN